MKMVNFGSGNICPKGWIALDSSPSVLLSKLPYFYNLKKILFKLGIINKSIYQAKWPKGIIFWDMRWGIPFLKNSVDIIYASHFLEHLPQKSAFLFLKKCHAILKDNGTIRLVVPDIDILVENYIKKIQDDPISTTSEFNLRIFEEGQHKHMYNFNSLSNLLVDIGFKNVKKFDFRKSKITDINKLETLKLKYYTSLYIEAQK
jgi:hypothetical protein